ncbi:hypothetical protein [Pandoraea apista]|uniref:hypothetical protein n=1 Tax=Pandoraea apista TaxID=93218 RepID=UPI000F6166C6|nr:hypothetical protein [Pandoraea apista]RRJ34367.1 hypothetical protein EIB05_03740 [Pandoraea apista]RRJ81488.1 hypothetical protein EIL82_03785 [Pandoraea apista]RSD08227.1 hypothetical protein EIZ52_24740 [Pandoraea apista]RSD16635.1 hypothetical protein EJB12_05220 [Pandoraea apista]RSK87520.1 hypothetical protein EJE96_02030 [Pandoraea apista]
MTVPEHIDNLADAAINSISVNNRTERILVERGVLEAIGHLTDPGVNSDATAMRQAINLLRFELGCPLPERMRLLFVTAFAGMLTTGRAASARESS